MKIYFSISLPDKSQLEVEDMDDGAACYFWTYAATLSFCCLVSSLHTSRVWNRLQCCTVDRHQAGDARGKEFQSVSLCEQRAASRLWPLMPPGRAITSCARWLERHYISHDAICLFASDTCCSWGRGPMIKLRAVTLKNKANDLIDKLLGIFAHVEIDLKNDKWATLHCAVKIQF